MFARTIIPRLRPTAAAAAAAAGSFPGRAAAAAAGSFPGRAAAAAAAEMMRGGLRNDWSGPEIQAVKSPLLDLLLHRSRNFGSLKQSSFNMTTRQDHDGSGVPHNLKMGHMGTRRNFSGGDNGDHLKFGSLSSGSELKRRLVSMRLLKCMSIVKPDILKSGVMIAKRTKDRLIGHFPFSIALFVTGIMVCLRNGEEVPRKPFALEENLLNAEICRIEITVLNEEGSKPAEVFSKFLQFVCDIAICQVAKDTCDEIKGAAMNEEVAEDGEAQDRVK